MLDNTPITFKEIFSWILTQNVQDKQFFLANSSYMTSSSCFCTPLSQPFAEDDSPQLTPRSILISPQSARSLDTPSVMSIRKSVSFEDSPSIVVIAPRPSYNPAEGPCLPMSAREFRLRNAQAAAKAAELQTTTTTTTTTPIDIHQAVTPPPAVKAQCGIIKRSCMLVRAISAPLMLFARVAQYPTTGCVADVDEECLLAM